MLKLKNIVKTYKVADMEVNALKGISLSFRKNEFVSILGPSGCGKTTTLNIIGGLDKYTSGDLVINGRSTKEFNDRDWDIYRNHRIGFIFQAYNLIPHQTILGNVELALTISGVSKTERTERAKAALDKVGLSGQYNKKPNQLSGGQCQRVAIARALVNNPEILLADEPTGALDTQTSIQIMELIKDISQDKLVIMVTHNPELAEQYSTRIIRLLDGELQSDSNPFDENDEAQEVMALKMEADKIDEQATANMEPKDVKAYKKHKKENAKMSFWTAFRLSARNLHSKLKRTIMVALAGCIGIVGVSAVLAVSTGVKGFIKDMQNDMISGNPVAITQSGMDYSAMLNSSSTMRKVDMVKAGDYVNVNSMIEYLVEHQDDIKNMFIAQDITEDYVQFIKDMPKEYYNAISYRYGFDITTNLYTDFTVTRDKGEDEVIASKLGQDFKNTNTISVNAIRNVFTSLLKETPYGDYASIITSLATPISQEIDNYDYILSQYDLVKGRMPQSKNDIMLVVDEDGKVSDLALAQLGYYTQEEFFNLVYKNTETEEDFDKYTNKEYKKIFEYDEIMSKKFYWYSNNQTFNKLSENAYTYNTTKPATTDGMLELNVCGIIRQKKNVDYGSLSASFYYTTELTDHILNDAANSEIVKSIKASDDGYLKGVVGAYDYVYKPLKENEYELHTNNLIALGTTDADISAMMGLFTGGNMSGLADMMTPKLKAREVGGVNTPNEIFIFSQNFKLKDKVTEYLDQWNDTKKDLTLSNGKTIYGRNSGYLEVDDMGTTDTQDDRYFIKGTGVLVEPRAQIKYQDNVGLIMAMITSMVDMVTIALVAFTALSLVVSTVMVGIITYVSVVERVKEIGVIRSLGGRKKDVSHLFNAETFIIGFSSGVIGIVITGIIAGVLNIIVNHAAGIKTIAILTPATAIIMVLLSVFLTMIAGIVPARAAAKQDPVNALRSE